MPGSEVCNCTLCHRHGGPPTHYSTPLHKTSTPRVESNEAYLKETVASILNAGHVHYSTLPVGRLLQMAYVIKGSLRSAFIEENGGDGAIVNDLSEGDVTFYPQGLMHYQQNLECEPATFVAAFSSEDPGSVTITTRFFELPTEAIEVMR